MAAKVVGAMLLGFCSALLIGAGLIYIAFISMSGADQANHAGGGWGLGVAFLGVAALVAVGSLVMGFIFSLALAARARSTPVAIWPYLGYPVAAFFVAMYLMIRGF